MENQQKPLEIRKGFAFYDFDNFVDDVTQSDVYFPISNVLNGLRNTDKTDRNLKQQSMLEICWIREIFNRFNDGVIQASILRAAKPEEVMYSIDAGLSAEMSGILETIIKYYKDEQGEALLEFLYAISIKKLSVTKPRFIEDLSICWTSNVENSP